MYVIIINISLQDNKAQHIIYRLSSFLPKNSSVSLSKGSIDVLLAQQPGEDHEPILTALILGWSQGNFVIKQVKRGLDIGLGNGEKENRVRVVRRRKDKSMCIPHWPVKSLEILNSLMVCDMLYNNTIYCVMKSSHSGLISFLEDMLYYILCNEIISFWVDIFLRGVREGGRKLILKRSVALISLS